MKEFILIVLIVMAVVTITRVLVPEMEYNVPVQKQKLTTDMLI